MDAPAMRSALASPVLLRDAPSAALNAPHSTESPGAQALRRVDNQSTALEEEPECTEYTEYTDERVGIEVVRVAKWKIRGDAGKWAERRRAQIRKGVELCIDANQYGLNHDQLERVMEKADAVLADVVRRPDASEELEMASAGFWMCALVLLQIYETKNRTWVVEGVPNRHSEKDMQQIANGLTLKGMREHLVAFAGTRFKDKASGGGEYVSNVGNNSGNKHGFSNAVTRADEVQKRFDLRGFGDDAQMKKKLNSLHLLLQEVHYHDGLPKEIRNLEAPQIVFFASSGSRQAKAIERKLRGFGNQIESGEAKHLRNRVQSVGTGVKTKKPVLGGKTKFSTGQSDLRKLRFEGGDFKLESSSDSERECDVEDGGHTGVARKKTGTRTQEYDPEYDEPDNAYLDRLGELDDEDERETKEQKKKRVLLERFAPGRNAELQAAPTAPVAEPGPTTKADVQAATLAAQMEALRAEQAAQMEALRAEQAAQMETLQAGLAVAQDTETVSATPPPDDLDEMEAIVDDAFDEFDEPIGAIDECSDECSDDPLVTLLTQSTLQAADSDSHARAVAERDARSATATREKTTFKYRIKAERASDALLKKYAGKILTYKEEEALNWFLEKVDVDHFEETGELKVPRKKRELTIEQELVKRRRELETKEARARIEERKALRKQKIKEDLEAAKQRKLETQRRKEERKQADYAAAVDKAEKQKARNAKKEQEKADADAARKRAELERHARAADASYKTATEKLERMRKIHNPGAYHASVDPDDLMKVHVRVPQLKKPDDAPAPPDLQAQRLARAERFLKRDNVVKATADAYYEQGLPKSRFDEKSFNLFVSARPLVNNPSTVYDLSKIHTAKRKSPHDGMQDEKGGGKKRV